MKKLILLCCLLASAGIPPLWASNLSIPLGNQKIDSSETVQVIAISDVTQEFINDFFQEKIPCIALECTQGERLPIHLSLQGDFLSLDAENHSTIQVLKTFYIRCAANTCLFSDDLLHWKEFEEFFTGHLQVSLHLVEGQPDVGLEIELSQRS